MSTFTAALRLQFTIAALLLAAIVLVQGPASAQVASGALSGTVSDSSGAIIPDAQIVMKNESSGDIRQTVSNSAGFFTVTAVQPGSYTVTVSAQGFVTWQEKNIAFSQGDHRTLPAIALQVAGTKQEVQVISANDVIAPVDTGESSQTLNTHMITELSIQGRDAAELIKIMPGVGLNSGLTQGGFNGLTVGTNNGPVGQYSANGTQPNGGLSMTVDGANIVDPGNQGTQIANINQDQIAEVKILTSAFGAEYAKGPVTFQAIGKSGGSSFHGEGYLYTRNSIFNAEDSLLKNQGVVKPDDHYYYPGGNIGGPVIIPKTNFNRNHDKLFFWAGYEYMKQQPSGSLHQYFVPTPQMLQGNFTPAYLASLGPAFNSGYGASATVPCGNNQAGCAALNGAIVNGQIPSSLFDPNGLALAKLFPTPNIEPNTHGGNNFQFLDSSPQNRWELKGRLDYSVSDNTKIFFSYNRQNETDLHPITVWWAPPQALPYPSPLLAPTSADTFSGNVTHVFSPTLTNETVVAYARYINPSKLQNPSAADPAKLGFNVKGIFNNTATQIPNLVSWSGGSGFPGFYAPAFGGNFAGGAFGGLKQDPSISDNITKVTGTHTLKFGFYWDFNGNEQTSGNPTQGQLNFETYGSTTTGNPLADLLIGHTQQFTQSSAAPLYNLRYHQYSFYGQDQWKIARRLTLTYGLRFDHLGQWYSTSGPGMVVWNPATYDNTAAAPALTGLDWHAIDKKVPISGFKSPLFYLAPRFGLAFDVFGNGNTVLRGGFGVYRYQFSYNDVSPAIDPPLGVVTFGTPTGTTSIAQVSSFTPSAGNGLGGTVNALQMGDGRVPRTESYDFIISQRTPWRSLLEIEYVGNQTQNMLIAGNGGSTNYLANINKVPLGAFFGPDPKTGVVTSPNTPGFTAQDYRPLANYQVVNVIGHGSYSNYNALQVLWQKQSGPLTFTANYTFSKVLGIRDGQTNNGNGNGTVIDTFNMAKNYGVLAYDHTHIFNAAYVINLPNPIRGNKFAGGALNGWELSGITQLQSGPPIQPNTSGNLNVQWPSGVSNSTILGTDAVTLVPALTCDPRSNLRSGQFFNPSCFSVPAQGHNGDVIWPYIKGPAFFNSDLALYKNFKIQERQNVQFRFSAFNFLNHPLPQFNANGNNDIKLSFQGPNSTLSPTNTNTLTSGVPQYTVGRRVVELSIKYNF